MQWEDDEEDELQDEKRSLVTQHRRKELPVYDDSFAKRLGQQSRSASGQRATERTSASLPTDAPRRMLIDENSRSWRSNDCVKVNPRCCGFPCAGDHKDSQRTSRFNTGSREPPTRSSKIKEPKNLGAVLTRKFFRSNRNVSNPALEEELASFRAKYELDMKEVREMFMGVHQELKRIGSHREDTSGLSSRRRPLSEAVSSRVDGIPELLRQTNRLGALHFAHIHENGHRQPNRRAKSAPRTRVNWDSDLPEEDSEHARAPTADLFKKVIHKKRLYLRKFGAALIEYEETRLRTDGFEFEQASISLRDVVGRLLHRANFATDWHFKCGIDAWLSRVIFTEIENAEESDRGARARQSAWEEYQRLSLLHPVDAINPGRDHCKSFHLFCNAKFDIIRNELHWLEDWPDDLVEILLEASKHVWRAQHLALAFNPVASSFSVKASQKFDARLMEPLEVPPFLQADSLLPSTNQSRCHHTKVTRGGVGKQRMDLIEGTEVCVTGGTGYIASCLIHALLQRGYKVRTTARNPDDRTKTGFLWEFPGATDRLQIFKAELLEETTFDKVVYGVHTVFHTACPVLYDPNGDPEVTMLNPALKGNANVLQSCTKSPSVKRVVMTSSCSAIRYDYNHNPEEPPLNESVWSNPEYCRDHKMWYALAKTLAEREATGYAARMGLDLVVICPSFVIGPSLTPVPTSTVWMILALLRDANEYPNRRIGFVHIDDVVKAHVLAMEVPEAHGRYICSSDVAHFGDIMSMLRTKYPKLRVPSRCSDIPGDDLPHKLDTTKITQLGLTSFKSIEQMFDDMLQYYLQNHLLESFV